MVIIRPLMPDSLRTENQPLIITFIADLFFSVKVEEAARRLNFRVEWIERLSQVGEDDPPATKKQLGKHLVGPGAVLAIGFPRSLATNQEMDQHFVLVKHVILAG